MAGADGLPALPQVPVALATPHTRHLHGDTQVLSVYMPQAPLSLTDHYINVCVRCVFVVRVCGACVCLHVCMHMSVWVGGHVYVYVRMYIHVCTCVYLFDLMFFQLMLFSFVDVA